MSSLWKSNLSDALLTDPLVLVHGNVKDLFPIDIQIRELLPPEWREYKTLTFDLWLALELDRQGYDIVCLYDSADKIVALRRPMLDRLRNLIIPESSLRSSVSMANKDVTPRNTSLADWLVPAEAQQDPQAFAANLAAKVFPRTDVRTAVIFRFADRYLRYTDNQDCNERLLSLQIQKAALSIPPLSHNGSSSSRLVLIFDIETQIPQELNSLFPSARSVYIAPPGPEERAEFFRSFSSSFDSGGEPIIDLAANKSHCMLLGHLSDGLRTQDLFSLALLSKREHLGLSPAQFPQLLTRFKFGTRENAWSKIDPERLRNAKKVLSLRVKGQDEVLDEIVPVLIRAKLGMSDLVGSSYSPKPRGAFFFVGPTGVGKTELSKSIAELLFGDEAALIRFDMSEYSEEHQQARLIGAPPGYVGFDQGGQLTNAIQNKPFSVVLFDEIEKAHGRILDKFLQILDDGRLTDGMGKTVYFSEAIIIFTSNIGTAPPPRRAAMAGSMQLSALEQPSINTNESYARLANLPYEELCSHFRTSVRDYFVNSLNRPEILNRIGEDNILVFRFLTASDAKAQIIDQQIENMQKALREKHPVGMHCTTSFKKLLMSHPGGFNRNGARGVRNLLNRFVLNKLAEDMFMKPEICRHRLLRVDYEAADEDIEGAPFNPNLLHYDWIEK